MLVLQDDQEPLKLEGFLAIVPSIGVGNAGQLACDLLISTLQLTRVGSLWHSAFIPIVGPSAFQHDPHSQATSCELYISHQKKLLVIQIRSPLIPQHLNDFNTKLVGLLEMCSKVVILASSFDCEKHTIDANSFEYIANEQFKASHIEKLNNLSWTEFGGEVIHGGGNAMKLYEVLNEKNVATLLLFKYVAEGDNSQDASLMVKELDDLLEDELQMMSEGVLKLIVPSSWKLLFGNDEEELTF